MTKKAVIFDCFGVLYPEITKNFFQRNIKLFDGDSSFMDDLDLQIDLGKITRREFLFKLEEKTKIPADKIESELDQDAVYDRDLVELIKKLKQTYKIGFLSNAGREEAEIIWRDKIDHLFDVKIISGEIGIVKPDPKIYALCLEKLGVKPAECAFIDDNPANVAGAQNIGMDSILYKDIDQLKSDLLKYDIKE